MTIASEVRETIMTLVGIAVTLGVGLLAVWATMRAQNPKLRLGYRLQSSAELLANHGSNGLSVTHNGTTLTSPHIASIQIVNQGRRDIVGPMFSSNVEFELGENILALLSSKSSPSTAHTPVATVSGSKLLLPPSHLRKKQAVTYTVLLDGPVSGLTATESLVDVDVKNAGSGDDLGFKGWALITLVSAIVFLLIGSAATMMFPNDYVAWLQELDNKFN
ncbi:hypothetical protein ACFY3G_17660 [Streptomyces phaeochromogenes]|uniref:hypothetical protein n=1 Tax=Streptomyces phaeochromogenes TaxID=1923 RepID=UPI0036C45724